MKTSQIYKIDCSLPPVRWLDCGYEELIITGLHTVATGDLPQLHKDPFDRLLLAQSKVDGIKLLTCDAGIAEYCIQRLTGTVYFIQSGGNYTCSLSAILKNACILRDSRLKSTFVCHGNRCGQLQ